MGCTLSEYLVPCTKLAGVALLPCTEYIVLLAKFPTLNGLILVDRLQDMCGLNHLMHFGFSTYFDCSMYCVTFFLVLEHVLWHVLNHVLKHLLAIHVPEDVLAHVRVRQNIARRVHIFQMGLVQIPNT